MSNTILGTKKKKRGEKKTGPNTNKPTKTTCKNFFPSPKQNKCTWYIVFASFGLTRCIVQHAQQHGQYKQTQQIDFFQPTQESGTETKSNGFTVVDTFGLIVGEEEKKNRYISRTKTKQTHSYGTATATVGKTGPLT